MSVSQEICLCFLGNRKGGLLFIYGMIGLASRYQGGCISEMRRNPKNSYWWSRQRFGNALVKDIPYQITLYTREDDIYPKLLGGDVLYMFHSAHLSFTKYKSIQYYTATSPHLSLHTRDKQNHTPQLSPNILPLNIMRILYRTPHPRLPINFQTSCLRRLLNSEHLPSFCPLPQMR